MIKTNQLTKAIDLENSVDWGMTTKKAAGLNLEGGTGWTRGNDLVDSDTMESIYFVLCDWKKPYQATLIRRTMKMAIEITKIDVPANLISEACNENGRLPGGPAHRLNARLTDWLSKQINGIDLDPAITTH